MAPVGSVLPSSARASLPPARRAPMIPEPMTVARSMAVPRNSAPSFCVEGGASHQAFSGAGALVRPISSSRCCSESLSSSRSAGSRRCRCADRACDARRRRRSAARPRCLRRADGSGRPQWAVMGWPGHTGQTSLAASSQTVKTKSSARPRARELLPRLRSGLARVVVQVPQKLQSIWVHRAARLASGAMTFELSHPETIDDALGDDRSCRVMCAQEQHIEWLPVDNSPPPLPADGFCAFLIVVPHSCGFPWQQS